MGGICGTHETDVKCREDFRIKIESGKALGKFRRRWEDITMALKRSRIRRYGLVSSGSGYGRVAAVGNTVIHFWIPQNVGNFLNS